MKIIDGFVEVEREYTDEKGVKYRQIDRIDLSKFDEMIDDVDVNIMKDSLGLSSNAKTHQLGLKVLKRIRGL